MAIRLNGDDFHTLRDMLCRQPQWRDEKGRIALADAAFAGEPKGTALRNQLHLAGGSDETATRFLEIVQNFGQVTRGTEALGILLHYLRKQVGLDDEDFIDELFDRYPLTKITRPVTLSPSVAINPIVARVTEATLSWKNQAELRALAEEHFKYARVANDVGNHEVAEEALLLRINLDDRDHITWYELGNACYSQGKYRSAIEYYDKAIKLKRDYIDAYNRRGNAHGALNEYPKAIADLSYAIYCLNLYHPANVNNRANAYYNRGYVFNALGQFLLSNKDESEAVNKFRSAIKDYNESTRLKPESVDVYYNCGISHRALKENDKAIENFKLAIKLESNYAIGYHALGVVYRAKAVEDRLNFIYDSNNSLAIENYSKAIELNAQYAMAYRDRGVVYKAIGANDKAIEDFNRAISLKIDCADTYFNRGNIHAESHTQESSNNAVADYNEAIKLRPNHDYAYCYRGIIYQRMGDFKRATADFDKAIEYNETNADAYCSRGIIHHEQGKYGKAMDDYKKSVFHNPTLVVAHCNLGILYKRQKAWMRAIECFNTAIKFKQDYTDAYFHRGIIYKEIFYGDKSNYDKALEDFRMVISLDIEHADAYYHLGDIYWLKADYTGAIACFENAIRLNSERADFYYSCALVFERINNNEQAIKNYEKYLELQPNAKNTDAVKHVIADLMQKNVSFLRSRQM